MRRSSSCARSQALRAGHRCTILAHSPAGTRPPWRSRPSWFFSVQMIASTRCRSQFGSTRGVFSSLQGRPDQGQAQVVAGEEGLGLLAGQALVGDDGGAGRRAVSGLVREHLPGLLAFAEELGVGQAEAGDGAVAGADRAAAWPPSTSASGWGSTSSPPIPYRSERFAVTADCPHGIGVASISRSISADPGV